MSWALPSPNQALPVCLSWKTHLKPDFKIPTSSLTLLDFLLDSAKTIEVALSLTAIKINSVFSQGQVVLGGQHSTPASYRKRRTLASLTDPNSLWTITSQVLTIDSEEASPPMIPRGILCHLFPGSPIFLKLGFFSMELEKGTIKSLNQSSH